MYDYLKGTTNSLNLLRRYAQRKRIRKGVELCKPDTANCSLLDFGCGSGFFLEELLRSYPQAFERVTGYEKFPSTYLKQSTVKANLILKEEEFLHHIETIQYDIVTCFEVLEHCHRDTQKEILGYLSQALKPNGKFIVSVPIETGLPALIKNIFRFRWNKKRRFAGYNFKNILLTTLGKTDIPYRETEGFLTHMGFDFRKLEKLFEENWKMERKLYSPFKGLPYFFNSQVFYELGKRVNG